MKKSVKITLIVAAALVGLGLCLSVAGFAMGGRLSELRNMHLDPATGQWEVADSREPTEDLYTGSDYVLPAETDITALDIDWITGEVEILVTDDDAITVAEEVGYNGYNAHPMVVTDDSGTLRIRYADETWMSAIDLAEKKLTVHLPRAVVKNLTDVNLVSVSADYKVDALTVREEFVFSSVSGDLETGAITAENVNAEVNTVSGKIQLDGSFRQVNGESTSGEIDLTLRTCPNKLSVATVSGDVDVELPRSAGFTLAYNTVSGDLECDFAAKRSGEKLICGNGGCEISVDTTSGDLKFETID